MASRALLKELDIKEKNMYFEKKISTELIFDLPIVNSSFCEIVEYFLSHDCTYGTETRVIVTPNVDHIVKVSRDKTLFNLYKKADIFTADGIPIVLSSRLIGGKIRERITGADLFVTIAERGTSINKKIFIIGGFPEEKLWLQEKLQEKLSCKETQLLIYCPPKGFSAKHIEMQEIIKQVNNFCPDYVFICLGFPKQEQVAFVLRDLTKVGLIFCVGASVEFYVGKIKRAPLIAQNFGMEWLWRLLSDPKRLWKRYLVEDPYFLLILFKEIIKKWKKRT